jgi:uncharacterized membrane protein YebE (DUF533 family)
MVEPLIYLITSLDRRRESIMDAIRLLGSLLGNQSLSSGLGGKLLGGLLGGGQQRGGGGGLGGLLGSVMGGSQQQGGSGLGGLLGSVLGGGAQQQGGQSGGGLGDLLGSVLGGGAQQQSAGGGALGGLLGSVLGGGQAPEVPQSQQAEANHQAEVIIRGMINAAKSDGRIDDAEKQKIIESLGADVSQDEIEFVQREFAAPLDVQSYARSVPRELAGEVYLLSLTSIELDSQNEAQYLGQLAQGLGIDPQVCNQIHDQVGAPKIFG